MRPNHYCYIMIIKEWLTLLTISIVISNAIHFNDCSPLISAESENHVVFRVNRNLFVMVKIANCEYSYIWLSMVDLYLISVLFKIIFMLVQNHFTSNFIWYPQPIVFVITFVYCSLGENIKYILSISNVCFYTRIVIWLPFSAHPAFRPKLSLICHRVSSVHNFQEMFLLPQFLSDFNSVWFV